MDDVYAENICILATVIVRESMKRILHCKDGDRRKEMCTKTLITKTADRVIALRVVLYALIIR